MILIVATFVTHSQHFIAILSYYILFDSNPNEIQLFPIGECSFFYFILFYSLFLYILIQFYSIQLNMFFFCTINTYIIIITIIKVCCLFSTPKHIQHFYLFPLLYLYLLLFETINQHNSHDVIMLSSLVRRKNRLKT